MTPEEATAYVSLHLQPSLDPVITPDELNMLIQQSRRADAEGHTIKDPDWIPTYALDWAIYAGWGIKAAKTAGNYQFSDNGQSFSRQQVYEHCIHMQQTWKRTRSYTTTTESPILV